MTIKRAPTSGRGVAHGLAVAIGIPPELAVPAGERAVAAMMALKQARDAGGGGLRQHHVARAQAHIAALDPARHGPLVQRLQAHALAMQGRGGDSRIAHVTPGEVVVPQRLQTPEIALAIQRAAQQRGLDPVRLRVGSGRNAINPRTGQIEFDDWGDGGVDGGAYACLSDAKQSGTEWNTVRPDEPIVPLTPPPSKIPGGPDESFQVRPDQGGNPAHSRPAILDLGIDGPSMKDYGPIPPEMLINPAFPKGIDMRRIPPPTSLPWPPKYDNLDENDLINITPHYSSGRYDQT